VKISKLAWALGLDDLLELPHLLAEQVGSEPKFLSHRQLARPVQSRWIDRLLELLDFFSQLRDVFRRVGHEAKSVWKVRPTNLRAEGE